LELCGQCLGRIEDGIDLLAEDPSTRRAFAWMNEAMLQQQLHYELSTRGRRTWVRTAGRLSLERPFERPDPKNPAPRKGQWRPFQLAFILMNLRSIAKRECPERAVVDLIWFPTGGGKTEAYLGLTAFSIFRRRLADPYDAGTTILMRYTLRLLTTQQFQRAASLICACEVIRRTNEAELGPVRISVGLWVGSAVTPNDNGDAVAELGNLLTNGKPNKFILLTCPWCGAEMGPVKIGSDNYQAKGYRKEAGKVVFRCEDVSCDFRDARGLPLLVVDEAIYEERPTLVIGTVDKFAMLPWLPQARRLFGLDDLAPVSPPELIIQDELHLISGALGSMVGIYEGTIDALCRRKNGAGSAPAKIVASTATICRAAEQVRSLYAREVFLFPPQGLRAGDSFFAEEAAAGKEGQLLPGRLYVGVFGTALSSHVTAQIRVMAALLQAVKCIRAPAPAALDPYWTLMAYFNSLRELGHAATLIRADIREYLNAVWDRLNIRKPAAESGQPDLRRFINRDLELTSRIQSSEITEVLQQLFNRYPGTDEQRPVDVCLATNMIQVGLDVPRLGLMTVVGQPKTTAEYIQATSRVGRDESGPGLVVTVYNPGKPRDRSHFEHFHSYHQSIYRWVEPTSVTPFAIPVRERALHAQLVTLLRYWGDDTLRKSPKPAPDEALVQKVREVILARINQVDGEEAAMAETQLTELVKKWRSFLPAKYGKHGVPPDETPLMYPSGTEPRMLWAARAKATPSSMRNVDAGCDAKVIPQFPQP
ncbi:MAG: helicase-related protein, partial [Opitutales bacterium]